MAIPAPIDGAAYEAFVGSLARSPEIVPVWRVLEGLLDPQRPPPDRTMLAKIDKSNGLRDWLDLLLALREENPVAASQPAQANSAVAAAMNRLRSVPPVRLYATEERRLAEQALQGLPPRRRAAQAIELSAWIPPQRIPNAQRSCQPVLAELANRLQVRGDGCRSNGQETDARTAYGLIIRLMSEVIADSPTPDLAMLAAEIMAPALRGLGATERAEHLEAFQQSWRQASQDDRINLIPCLGQAVLAPRAHNRVMRTAVAGLVTMTTAVLMLVLCVVWLVTMTAAQPPDHITLQWRAGGRAAWWAPIIAVSPLLATLAMLAAVNVPWTWLVSGPSLPAVLLSPLVLLVSTGTAAWLCVKPAEPLQASPLPTTTIWIIAVLFVPTVLTVIFFVPVSHEPWAPPVSVQRFRQWGLLGGMAAGAVAIVWLIAGMIHRTRTGMPAGVWARANLTVTAAAFLLTTCLLVPVLGINKYCDRLHERAFVQAVADPIADRLGPDWKRPFLQATTRPSSTEAATEVIARQ